jgi:hypothetical protein
MSDEQVLVNSEDLATVVNYLLYEEEKDYRGQEDHIYRFLLPLAEACGLIESAEETLAEIHEELAMTDLDSEVDRLLDELDS